MPRKERKGKDALLQGCPNVLSILVKLVAPSSLWGKALQIGQKACHYFVLTVLTRRSRWDPDSHSFPNFMITMVDLLFCDLPFNILMGKCLVFFFLKVSEVATFYWSCPCSFLKPSNISGMSFSLAWV